MKEIESMKVWSNVSMSICMIFVVWGAIPILISWIGIIVSFCHRWSVSWLDDYTNIDKINVFQKIKVRKSSPLLWRILHKTMQHSLYCILSHKAPKKSHFLQYKCFCILCLHSKIYVVISCMFDLCLQEALRRNEAKIGTVFEVVALGLALVVVR